MPQDLEELRRKSRQAIEAVRRDGLSKSEIRGKFDCVVGVQDATFKIARGEIYCIMGLSGSGKFTLIRPINRLIEPTSGTVFIEGQNINAMNPRQLPAERIGWENKYPDELSCGMRQRVGHLIQVVGDVDDANAARLEIANHGEQPINFAVVQRGCGSSMTSTLAS